MEPRFIVDSDGRRIDVVLTIEEFQSLCSDAGYELARPTSIPDLDALVAEETFSYEMPRKGAYATGRLRFPKFIVNRGSIIANSEASATPSKYKALRKWLIEQGVVQRNEYGSLQFERDYVFANVSEAVCVVEGGSRSGYESWRNSRGSTLKSLGWSRNEIPTA
jgi:hypothetical protein